MVHARFVGVMLCLSLVLSYGDEAGSLENEDAVGPTFGPIVPLWVCLVGPGAVGSENKAGLLVTTAGSLFVKRLEQLNSGQKVDGSCTLAPWGGRSGSLASPGLGFCLPVAKYAHAAPLSSCRAWHLGLGIGFGLALGGYGEWLVAAMVQKETSLLDGRSGALLALNVPRAGSGFSKAHS